LLHEQQQAVEDYFIIMAASVSEAVDMGHWKKTVFLLLQGCILAVGWQCCRTYAMLKLCIGC